MTNFAEWGQSKSRLDDRSVIPSSLLSEKGPLEGRRLNGLLELSLNDKNVLFLVTLLDKTVSFDSHCIKTLAFRVISLSLPSLIPPSIDGEGANCITIHPIHTTGNDDGRRLGVPVHRDLKGENRWGTLGVTTKWQTM